MFRDVSEQTERGGIFFLIHIPTTPVNIFPGVQICGNGLTMGHMI
jgi:hypothetical protein